MVRLAIFVATLALVYADDHAGGMMDMNQMQMMQNMMNMMQNMQGGNRVPMGNGGCNEGSGGSGCQLPMPQMPDMEEYIEQQMKSQQYENQQMTEEIRAQFEKMVMEVTAKKHRFVMSLVAEFVSTCTCADANEQIYQGLFIQQAAALNLTTEMDMWDSNRRPYEAENEEDLRALLFGGLFRGMCEAAGSFLTFAEQVNNRIPAFTVPGKKK